MPSTAMVSEDMVSEDMVSELAEADDSTSTRQAALERELELWTASAIRVAAEESALSRSATTISGDCASERFTSSMRTVFSPTIARGKPCRTRSAGKFASVEGSKPITAQIWMRQLAAFWRISTAACSAEITSIGIWQAGQNWRPA